MAKKDVPEVNEEQKVQTKYDRKVAARAKQKEKDKKQEKTTKVTTAIIGVALAAVIVVSIVLSVASKATALKGTYVKVGDHSVSQVEYDYYYNTTVNSYLSTYSSILPYLGLDTSADFSKQQYTEDMTWKDMFDQMTVDQMKQIIALTDDAAKNGFVCETLDENYNTFVNGMSEAASTEGMSVNEYYKQCYGTYATASSIESSVKNYITAGTYYTELMTNNTPTDDEVKAYYEEHVTEYDKVDYRSYVFTTGLAAEASEEEVATATEEIKANAQAMLEALKEGADFNELCIEYSSEEAKANYQDSETDYSLMEGRTSSALTTIVSDWMYADGREAGELAVLEDTDNNRYYVVEFINRYYDEADDANISNTIANQRAAEYVQNLVATYDIVDTKGNLKYLTISSEQPTDETSDAAADEQVTSEE